LNGVEGIWRDLSIFGKQTEIARGLQIFVENFERATPSDFLFVVDFAEVEDGSLRSLAGGEASVFDDTKVAMGLSVLLWVGLPEKH
jgi:hypothetical protein